MARVERHGNSWRAVYVGAHGRRVREVLPAQTKTEARQLAAKLERRAWLQRRGLELGPEELTGTLAELCSWWLEKRCPEASRRGGATSGLAKHVIRGAVGAIPLARLRSHHLDDLLHERQAAGAAPATLNNLRAQLRTVFAKAKKAGWWFGHNPLDCIERRKVPKRVYRTLSPEQMGKMLAEVPADWRPLFACAALGLRKGELFALRKSDVDLARGTITVARSHERDTTKGGAAAVLPLPTPLRPWIEYQLAHAPGHLVFPAPDGSQRTREADPQKILRHALARAGIVEGYEHRCRWCAQGTRQRCRASLLSDLPQGHRRPRPSARRASWTAALARRPAHSHPLPRPAPHLRNRAAPPRSGLVSRAAPHAAQRRPRHPRNVREPARRRSPRRR
jgi:integrase